MAGTGKKEFPEALRSLNPAWFALVMATGIVSIAANAQSIPVVPVLLMWANVVFYAVLWVAYVARLAVYPRSLFRDLRSHTRSMGYFTMVAGSGVLGTQLLLVGGYQAGARSLWFVTLVTWIVLVYAIPVSLVARREGKPGLAEGIQGNWLLWTVGTASVSVLGTRVAPTFGVAAGQVVFWSYLLWLVSVIFYLWVIAMIVQRLFFHDLSADALVPTYWIDMGAVAIATLAGATALQTEARPPLLIGIEPFTIGLTLLLWITASWWIPWLFFMGLWRHVILRQSPWFQPTWWSLVFPLGMYATATGVVSRALQVPAIFGTIAQVFAWIALAAWAATFINMLVTFWRKPLSSGTS